MHPLENGRLSAQLPEQNLICIVKFRDDLQPGLEIPQPPAVHFQVTVARENVSPSGRYIRFGTTPGDELTGWMRRDAIEVCEVLLVVNKDGTACLPSGEPVQLNVQPRRAANAQ